MFKYGCRITLELIIMFSLILGGCSAITGALTSAIGASSKSGMSAELHVGDKEIDSNIGGVQGTGNIEVKKGNVSVTTSKNTSNIEQAEAVSIYESPSPIYILLMLLGWILPTPRAMFVYSKAFLSRIKPRGAKRDDTDQSKGS